MSPFVLMIAFLLKDLNVPSSCRYEIVTRSAGFLVSAYDFDHFQFFLHLGNLDVLQHLLDAFIHFAQRLAHRAAVALAAFPAHRHARRNEQRAINRLDHLKRRNRFRLARQRVAAVDAMLRSQQTRLRQALQNLRQRFLRDAVSLGHILRAACALVGVLCQVLHRHQAVIGFFGQFQHAANPDLFGRIKRRLFRSHIDSNLGDEFPQGRSSDRHISLIER